MNGFVDIFTSELSRSIGIWAGVAMIAVWWIRGMAARRLAKDAGDATLRGEERGLREYLDAELKKCKLGHEVLSEQLQKVENKNFQLTVVVSMMLTELLAIDAESDIVKRAKAVLELNIGFPANAAAIEAAIQRLQEVAVDRSKSSALYAAEQAVTAAEKTVVRPRKRWPRSRATSRGAASNGQ